MSLTGTNSKVNLAIKFVDHDPSGEPLKNKRVIQMGLKNIPTFASGEDILRIDDLTDFVANCARNDPSKLTMPKYLSD